MHTTRSMRATLTVPDARVEGETRQATHDASEEVQPHKRGIADQADYRGRKSVKGEAV